MRWLCLPLAIATALLVYVAMDRLSSGQSLFPHPLPRAFVPPPVKKIDPPAPPQLTPVQPPAPAFAWESK